MEVNQFINMILDMAEYFERTKPPTDKAIRLWCSDLGFIPATARHGVLEILKRLDTWPRNVPAAITVALREWRAKNPEAQRELRDCRDCGGEGLLHLRRLEKEIDGRERWAGPYLFRCLQCDQVQMGIPGVFLASALREGWKEDSPENYREVFAPVARKVQHCTNPVKTGIRERLAGIDQIVEQQAAMAAERCGR